MVCSLRRAMHRLVEDVLSPSAHGTSAKGHAKGQVEEGIGHVSLFCRRRLADGCCFMRVQVTKYASASSGRRAPYSASQFCAYWGVPRSTFVNSARHFSTPLVLCAVMSLSQFCTAIPSPGTTVTAWAVTRGLIGNHRGPRLPGAARQFRPREHGGRAGYAGRCWCLEDCSVFVLCAVFRWCLRQVPARTL